MAPRLLSSCQAVMMACLQAQTVSAFAPPRFGSHDVSLITIRRDSTTTSPCQVRNDNCIGFGNRIRKPVLFHIATRFSLSAGNDDDEPSELDTEAALNDQREGMADAFSALGGLSAGDFDDLKSVPFSEAINDGDIGSSANFEMEVKQYMDMQGELSTLGEEGLYADILGDLASSDENAGNVEKKNYLNIDEGEATLLGNALEEAALLNDYDDTPAAPTSENYALADADGIGFIDQSSTLTTADVTNDVLNQDIKPSLDIDNFMTNVVEEAVADIATSNQETSETADKIASSPIDIARTAEELMQDESLRQEIEEIFDRAGVQLRAKVEEMRKEQDAVTQENSKRGLDYIESEKQRLAEAEESVSRLIQKVSRETEEVQKAMEELERAKNEVGSSGKGGLEDTALDLKKGGLIKQASLVGGLLFGSRAFTETILVLGSPYGEDHFVSAILQGVIALVCAAYFFLVK